MADFSRYLGTEGLGLTGLGSVGPQDARLVVEALAMTGATTLVAAMATSA